MQISRTTSCAAFGPIMSDSGYKQFCPVARASEILCTRWTMMFLRELLPGTTRLNDLQRGLPRMSPALLSKRLKELEAAAIITRTKASDVPISMNMRSRRRDWL